MAQQQTSLLCLDTVDDFYFSVVSDDETDPNVPVSDDKYAEALQFQETLLASLITAQQNPSSSKTVDEELLFNETLMASSSMLQPPLLCVASSSK
ncbi:putative E3 ubiquitin-protein ligase RNF144A-like, partial [Trifolium medium]|nr:putative E3 ubiquitin-protein ligase RNF144A-like [Trifolium medium]